MNPTGCIVMSLLGLAVLLGGCAGDQASLARVASEETCARADALVQETQAQLARLRSEMAQTRIQAAKKEAELQELRRNVEALQVERTTLQKSRAEQRDTVAAQEAELTRLRDERDRLEQARKSVQVSRGAADGSIGAPPPAVQTKINALEASVVALTTQIQHLQQRRDTSPLGSSDRNGSLSITVQPGDTLGKLAASYGVTVEAIQEANGLTGSLIIVGQRLFIPRTEHASE